MSIRKNDITIDEFAQKIYNLVHGKRKKNLRDAYSLLCFKCNVDYSYDEIKDYLFNHDMKITE